MISLIFSCPKARGPCTGASLLSSWLGARMNLFVKTTLLASLLCLHARAAEPAPILTPSWDSSAWNVESGLLWEIGTGTPIPYRLVPTMLSWRSSEFLHHTFAGGSHLVVRHRLTLVGTWIQQGPESHYLALAGSPSLELWDKTGAWSLFTGAGGGAGFLDSRGVKGGQGQDFTLNWFIRGGLEHVIKTHGRLSAGVMYQHMSNGGQTKPNPGIDALGFTLGYSWSY